ncbi:hypothetical protein JOH51_000766 [Rhizobium leguminosarum]|nr:hypothetical protein [Rhizobium leguminosarum]
MGQALIDRCQEHVDGEVTLLQPRPVVVSVGHGSSHRYQPSDVEGAVTRDCSVPISEELG